MRGFDFGKTVAMVGVKTNDGLKTARVFWGILERIAEMEAEK